VHIPTNPTFGDIYVKNRRSKDDIGFMLRSIAQIKACAPRLDATAQADLAQMDALYSSWAKRVDEKGFVIETLDKDGNLFAPNEMLAVYTLTGNVECLGALAIRLEGQGSPGDLDCKNGLPNSEALAWLLLKNDARQIGRTNHAAALALAYEKGQNGPALELLKGLASRVEIDMAAAESGSPPASFVVQDVASELAFAADVGLPLTSREVRWLHTRLHDAYVGMRDPAVLPTYHVFDAATPDGAYAYDPPDTGLFFRDLGMLLGSCASPYRNPDGRPILDCARLLAAF
jgi:hypothetical protein